MKLRKNRGVSQGSSNFKTFIVSNPSFTKINQTLVIKNTYRKQIQNYGKRNVHTNEIIQDSKNKNQIFDKIFPQPKIFNDQSYFPPKKSKVQQILLTLKNACQYKQYQYFKVFNFLDEQKNGKINTQSVQKLIKCFGYEINQNQADLFVSYMNGNKGQKQIHKYQSQNSNLKQRNKQSYFTIQDFMQKIGNYAEPDLKITGDPLAIKVNSQKEKKLVSRTARRNESINVKKLLVDPFVQQQPQRNRYRQATLKTDQITVQKQTKRSRKARFSRFKQLQQNFTQKTQKPNVKRIQSANPLIPRSSLPQQYFNKQYQNSLTFKRHSNNNFIQQINDKFIADQYDQKIQAKSRYQNKLKKIIDNNELMNNRCKKQNQFTLNKQKFTQSWGMLSCANGWVRS